MSDKDGAAKGVFALAMIAIILAVFFFLSFAFQGRHAHGQESVKEGERPVSKSETAPRSQLGIPLPKGCVSHPCGYYRGRLKSGIAEVVECPIGVEPPAYMDLAACRK